MKNWLILLFLIAIWHCESFKSVQDIKSRLEILSNQKSPFLEICSVQVVPDVYGYQLMYETLNQEDEK